MEQVSAQEAALWYSAFSSSFWVTADLFKADNPVLQPVIYNPSAAAGSRFTTMPGSSIPRLYHSTAILLPSGEVLVAGSNPAVGYSASGKVGGG